MHSQYLYQLKNLHMHKSCQGNYFSRHQWMCVKTCLKVMGDFTDHFLHSQGSQSDISLTTFPAHHLERRDRQSAQCAVRRRGVVGRLPPTCVDSASFQCVLFHVLILYSRNRDQKLRWYHARFSSHLVYTYGQVCATIDYLQCDAF